MPARDGLRPLHIPRMPSPFLLLAALLVPGAQKDAEALEGAEKNLNGGTEESVRRGARQCLEIGSAAAMELLLKTLRGEQPHFRDIAWETLPLFTDPYARELVEAELKKNKKDPFVRQWCAQALGLFGDPTPGPTLEKALADADAGVRRAAARALGQIRFAPAAKALRKAAGDKDPQVRANALLALAALPAEDGVELLRRGLSDEDAGARAAVLAEAGPFLPDSIDCNARALEDEDWRVRLQAVDNLRRAGDRDSVKHLIDGVDDARPAVTHRAVRALQDLTGARWTTRADWERWWGQHGGAYAGAEAAASATADASSDPNATVALYNGLPIHSDHVVFLIDCSAGMAEISRSRGQEKGELARAELAQTLGRLPETTKFNVLGYSSDVAAWGKAPQAVNPRNARTAVDFLKEVRPRGAKNIWLALTTALADPTVDTVFLLSSGEPEVGLYVHYNRVVEHLVDLNRFRKVVVHTVVYSDEKWYQDQLIKISEATGGKFIAVP